MSGYISDAVIRRMPAYIRHLRELEKAGIRQISSQELGERMGLTPSQVRQDFNSIGGIGRQGCGYFVRELREHICRTMGLDKPHRMVIVGAGRMGRSLANYTDFSRDGFETVALFDNDPERIRLSTERLPIYPVEELAERLPGLKADIGVLAVPAECAQAMLNLLYENGIRAIWNFAPVDLNYPRSVAAVDVHLGDTLSILSFRMKRKDE